MSLVIINFIREDCTPLSNKLICFHCKCSIMISVAVVAILQKDGGQLRWQNMFWNIHFFFLNNYPNNNNLLIFI